MFKSRDNLSPSCSSSEELVAYLYGELASAEQSVFENHLAGCDMCTAEFAELSLARLGVYEWRRDEFAELATPPIVIPYGEAVKVSWTDAVSAFFASPAQWATAGGAFAVLAILAGVWFMSPKTTDIAGRPEPMSSPIVATKQPEPKSPVQQSRPDSNRVIDQPEDAIERDAARSEPKVVKAAVSKETKKSNVQPAKVDQNEPRPVRPQRPAAPRLNDFEDEDDNTLRLGDLLAEVDTRD